MYVYGCLWLFMVIYVCLWLYPRTEIIPLMQPQTVSYFVFIMQLSFIYMYIFGTV